MDQYLNNRRDNSSRSPTLPTIKGEVIIEGLHTRDRNPRDHARVPPPWSEGGYRNLEFRGKLGLLD